MSISYRYSSDRFANSSSWGGEGGRSFNNSGLITFTAVPIPATIALLALGLVGIGAARRKQR
jgi:hypothetical protein